MNWLFYAIMSAIFAALTAIFAKIGIKNVDSNLATAIRTVVITVFAWGIVIFANLGKDISKISRTSMIFILLSGLTTGLSWLFYFRALQLGEASKVAPIDKLSLALTIVLAVFILKEKVSLSVMAGAVLMSLGAIIVAWGK